MSEATMPSQVSEVNNNKKVHASMPPMDKMSVQYNPLDLQFLTPSEVEHLDEVGETYYWFIWIKT
jgi:hypothetical protein